MRESRITNDESRNAPSPRLASSAPLSRVPGEGKIENDLCLMKGKRDPLYLENVCHRPLLLRSLS